MRLSVLAALLVLSCQTTRSSNSSVKIVGGKEAAPGDYPATIALASLDGASGCSAVKVAPRAFLTAGHCVHEQYLPGMAIKLIHGVNTPASPADHYTVKLTRVVAHESWLQRDVQGSLLDITDLGLLEVAELTPGIQVATLDFTEVKDGATVTMVGYGCEYRFAKDDPAYRGMAGRLKFARAALQPKTGRAKIALPEDADGQRFHGCPGDSGGPLYDSETLHLIGINTMISNTEHFTGFARIDRGVDDGAVSAWIEAVVGAADSATSAAVAASVKGHNGVLCSDATRVGPFLPCGQDTIDACRRFPVPEFHSCVNLPSEDYQTVAGDTVLPVAVSGGQVSLLVRPALNAAGSGAFASAPTRIHRGCFLTKPLDLDVATGGNLEELVNGVRADSAWLATFWKAFGAPLATLDTVESAVVSGSGPDLSIRIQLKTKIPSGASFVAYADFLRCI